MIALCLLHARWYADQCPECVRHDRMLAAVRAATPSDRRDYARDARPADVSPARDVSLSHPAIVAADDRREECAR